jgi:hypothetical protein
MDSWRWRGSGRPHGNARLQKEQVTEILELKGRFSSREVAAMFDIGQNTVLDIWRGKTWRNANA